MKFFFYSWESPTGPRMGSTEVSSGSTLAPLIKKFPVHASNAVPTNNQYLALKEKGMAIVTSFYRFFFLNDSILRRKSLHVAVSFFVEFEEQELFFFRHGHPRIQILVVQTKTPE